ncbi:MAG: hypothetical protein FWH26_07720 [Oscillospiraceae bacterium]|nr:hypothetical protein [Oscillospiraceae bacterium]
MKKIHKILIAAGIAVLVPALLFGAVRAGMRPPTKPFDKRFSSAIAAQACWNNTLDARIPQTAVYGVMTQHMREREDGTVPKLLFIGYDGALATAAGTRAEAGQSAIGDLAGQGGLWLTYTGGEKAGDQVSKTAPSWTSIFTGVWAKEHGIFDNGGTLSPTVRTILYELAAQKKEARFSFSWKPHLTDSYQNEAAEYPEIFQYCNSDDDTFASMLKAIEAGSDAVFGILEYTDHAGHATGYSTGNRRYMEAMEQAEKSAALLIEAAQARMEEFGEDWMIVIASDHGGFINGHYAPTLMETTTFFACSKPVF